MSPYLNNVNLKFLLKNRETQSNDLCIYSIKISIKYQGLFINKTQKTIQNMRALWFFLRGGYCVFLFKSWAIANFPDSPVVKTSHYQCRGRGFDPRLGN